jgi:hypothetical protein
VQRKKGAILSGKCLKQQNKNKKTLLWKTGYHRNRQISSHKKPQTQNCRCHPQLCKLGLLKKLGKTTNMNPFGMCQTLEIKARTNLHVKSKRSVCCAKFDQIRILKKKMKKEKKKKHERKKKNTSYLDSMQARKLRIEDCSQQILALLIYPHTIRQHLPDS